MRIRSGVGSPKVRGVAYARPGGRSPVSAAANPIQPKPQQPKTSGRHEGKKAWTPPWHPIGESTVDALRGPGFLVLMRDDGWMIQSRWELGHNLVRIRRSANGFEAQAAGNASVGRTAAFRKASLKGRKAVDAALRERASGGSASALVATIQVVGAKLKIADGQFRAKPAQAAIRVARDPDERSTSVRAISGGLPTLGKRR